VCTHVLPVPRAVVLFEAALPLAEELLEAEVDAREQEERE